MTWHQGDRLTDPAWPGRVGTVINVDDYSGGVQVVTVRWDGGGYSDFTPGPETRRVEET